MAFYCALSHAMPFLPALICVLLGQLPHSLCFQKTSVFTLLTSLLSTFSFFKLMCNVLFVPGISPVLVTRLCHGCWRNSSVGCRHTVTDLFSSPSFSAVLRLAQYGSYHFHGKTFSTCSTSEWITPVRN